jgi:hypothetical protein
MEAENTRQNNQNNQQNQYNNQNRDNYRGRGGYKKNVKIK